MSTNKICEALEARAMREAREHLDRSLQAYRQAINMQGSDFTFPFYDKDGEEKTFYNAAGKALPRFSFHDTMKAITENLMRRRESGIKKAAVDRFMEQFGLFNSVLQDIAARAEEMGE